MEGFGGSFVGQRPTAPAADVESIIIGALLPPVSRSRRNQRTSRLGLDNVLFRSLHGATHVHRGALTTIKNEIRVKLGAFHAGALALQSIATSVT